MTASDGHDLDTVLLIDPALVARRSSGASRQAWARERHLVEFRSWRVPSDVGDEEGDTRWGNLVEALCGQVCLRAVFVGCGRPMGDHSAAEVAAMVEASMAEHVKVCPSGEAAQPRIVSLR